MAKQKKIENKNQDKAILIVSISIGLIILVSGIISYSIWNKNSEKGVKTGEIIIQTQSSSSSAVEESISSQESSSSPSEPERPEAPSLPALPAPRM
jgi:flagellar basal body-associated protein FliL